MRVSSNVIATVLLAGCLALAQTAVLANGDRTTAAADTTGTGTAGTVCPPAAAGTTGTVGTTTTTTTTMGTPVASTLPTVAPVCPTTNVSADTSCLVQELAAVRGELRALRGEMRATALSLQGQMIISQMSQLQLDEMTFRQQLAANPRLPGAQATAMSLENRARLLNSQIMAFNNELAMVPPDQRPYMQAQLNTFNVAYWQPAMQNFTTYRTTFTASAYQPAVNANPWLPSWSNRYQASLNNVATTNQNFASAWWVGPQVAGTVETTGTMGTMGTGTAGNAGTTDAGTTGAGTGTY
ncbi:MAG: hypothetical protein ACYDBB_11625 [Armatimonadota bacterium]